MWDEYEAPFKGMAYQDTDKYRQAALTFIQNINEANFIGFNIMNSNSYYDWNTLNEELKYYMEKHDWSPSS